jgi:HK97 family phage prohead protease
MSKNQPVVHLRNPLIAQQDIRARIDESRQSIGLGPLPSHNHSAADAIAYGQALAAQTARRELNRIHLEAGHPELAHDDWLDTPSKGCRLFEQTRRAVVVDALSDGPMPGDSEIHARTIARLRGMTTRPSQPASGVRKTLPIRLMEVKFIGNGRRIRGFASTADVDLMGDVVMPAGMVTKLPIPLLWQHRHDEPIGTVLVAEIRKDGIWIEAALTEGIALADDALKLIEARSVDAFSIGFLPLESEPMSNGGMRFKKWRMTEVSAVSVPANPNARIARQIDGTVRLQSTRGAVRLVK